MEIFSIDTLMHRMDMRIEAVMASDVTATVSIPVAGNTQIHGSLHGGATAALAETAASLAANEYAQTTSSAQANRVSERIAVGSDMSISHLRSVTQGRVYAHAIPEHVGRSRIVHRVEVYDDEKRLVASARVTNLVITPR